MQIVPSTVISMGDGGSDGSSAFSNLLGLLMTLTTSEKLGIDFTGCEETPERQAVIDTIKSQLLQKLAEQPEPQAAPVVPAAFVAAPTQPATTAAAAVPASAASDSAPAVDRSLVTALDGPAVASDPAPAAKPAPAVGATPVAHGDGVDRWLSEQKSQAPDTQPVAEPKAKKKPRKPGDARR